MSIQQALSKRLKWARIALVRYYSVPSNVAFKQFRDGAIYFAVGLGSVLAANKFLPLSAQQEWIVFFGLIITAIGFGMALMAEARLIISRFVQFARKPR